MLRNGFIKLPLLLTALALFILAAFWGIKNFEGESPPKPKITEELQNIQRKFESYFATTTPRKDFVAPESPIKCDKPREYKIGKFDDRFGIAPEEFLNSINEAEILWEKASGRDLFRYNSAAEFPINLIFDEKQQRVLEAKKSLGGLTVNKTSYDALILEFDRLLASYERDTQAFNAAVKTLNEKISLHNAEVNSWNEKGGAPQNEFERLEKEREALEAEAKRLEIEENNLEKLADTINLLVNQINALSSALNLKIAEHNRRYGVPREFKQGEYTGRAINIYQFYDRAELKLVLAHELGHALGIGHVTNPSAIMYHLMQKQNVENISLVKEEITLLQKICPHSIEVEPQ